MLDAGCGEQGEMSRKPGPRAFFPFPGCCIPHARTSGLVQKSLKMADGVVSSE